MSLISNVLRTPTAYSHFRKTSKLSYSVWRSVKNENAFESLSTLSSQNGVTKVLINFKCSPYIKNCSVSSRLVSNSVSRYKEPSSKVEETVERLKEKKKTEVSEPSAAQQNIVTTPQIEEPKVVLEEKTTAESKEVAVSKKKSLWIRFKDECMHYYSGFKLLFLDVKVSSKILFKIIRGKPLTRRESRQLVRTTSVSFRSMSLIHLDVSSP